jgi:hypothetical protein
MNDFSDIPLLSEQMLRYRAQREAKQAAHAIEYEPAVEVSPEPVVLGVDTATGEQVRLAQEERTRGLYVIGSTGMGKSTLYINLIMQDMEQGLGLCVIDPTGDLIADIVQRIPKKREKHVILLDMTDKTYAFGLNLFDNPEPNNPIAFTRTREQVVQVFRRAWGEGAHSSWGPRLEDLLRNIAHTMLANPGYTLVEVPDLLSDDAFRASLVANVRERTVRQFWEREYDPLHDREQREIRASTLNKVRAFISDDLLRHIVGQRKSTIDFRRMMDRGQIVLVKLSEEHEDTTSLLGSLIVSRILSAALSRADIPKGERTQFNLYADEYQLFATPDFIRLLTRARKYGIATTIAHQFRGQLDALHRGATLQVGSTVVFRVEDGEDLTNKFDRTPPEAEVIGEEPVMIFAPDPFDYLLKEQRHSNDEVLHIIQELKHEMLEDRQRYGDYIENYAREIGRAKGHEWAKEALEEWDRSMAVYREEVRVYLYERMTGIRLPEPPPRPTISKFARLYEDYRRKYPPRPEEWWLSRQRRLGDILEKEHIKVPSGQYIPKRGTQRPFGDVKEELASKLATMPLFHARCRLEHGEFTIKTLPPQEQKSPADSAAIRSASQQRYYRLRTDIEQEIAKRQPAPSQSEQEAQEIPVQAPRNQPEREAGKTRISRRHRVSDG